MQTDNLTVDLLARGLANMQRFDGGALSPALSLRRPGVLAQLAWGQHQRNQPASLADLEPLYLSSVKPGEDDLIEHYRKQHEDPDPAPPLGGEPQSGTPATVARTTSSHGVAASPKRGVATAIDDLVHRVRASLRDQGRRIDPAGVEIHDVEGAARHPKTRMPATFTAGVDVSACPATPCA